MGRHSIRWFLLILNFLDRLRLEFRLLFQKGVHIHPAASENLGFARFKLGEGAQLHIAAGVVTDRRPGQLHFLLGRGARVDVEEGTWLRTEVGPITIVAFEDAQIRIGPGCFLNGCYVSSKKSVTLGQSVNVGMGSRIFDADQHDFDESHPEGVEPVQIEDHVWVASDVTVLKGVTVGAHSVVGSRSVVTRDIPPHSLALGLPAQVKGKVGDRTGCR